MAEYSQTIRNGIGIVGGGPASLWNAHNWNAFKWGEGTRDIGQNVLHLVSAGFSLAASVGFAVQHLISEGFSLSQALGSTPYKAISESFTISSETVSETLYDGAGYRYLLVGQTTEAESRFFPTWAQGSAGSGSWTAASATSTTWSET